MNLFFNYGIVAFPATLLILQVSAPSVPDDPWRLLRELVTLIVSLLLAWAVKYVRESRAEVKSAKLSLPSSEDFLKLKADVALLTEALERVRHERDEAQGISDSMAKALTKANTLLEEERAINANWGKVSEASDKKIFELEARVELLNTVNARVEQLAVQIPERLMAVLASEKQLKGENNGP